MKKITLSVKVFISAAILPISFVAANAESRSFISLSSATLDNASNGAFIDVSDQRLNFYFNESFEISDYYQIHDYVVQAKNAFYQTMMGIYNLKRYGIRVEIRIVLHKITIPRLVKFAHYIYKNLAFVDHIAFMGLEITGFTLANLEDLWIEPKDYIPELTEAVEFLGKKGMNVSIYNTPLCLLPIEVWQYARKSISDWKNIYFDECSKCAMHHRCGGLFASAVKRHSQHIKAFDKVIEENACEIDNRIA